MNHLDSALNCQRIQTAPAGGTPLIALVSVSEYEDIGFYMAGDQISPEVVHHHFYHWIRGYCEASENYVKAWQRKEPARWNHLKKLYETVTEVEVEEGGLVKAQLVLKLEDLEIFLKDEVLLAHSAADRSLPDGVRFTQNSEETARHG